MTKHYLNFISTGRGLMQIDEPEGFDQAVFEILQEDGRHGRDVFSVTNEKGKLRLTGEGSDMDHKFEYVIEAYEQDGFEAEVKYIVEFDGVQNVVGEISFQSINTDKLTFVELAIVEENYKTLFKKRFDAKTNLFSNKTLDNADITPVQTVKVLQKAKPIIQISEWSNPIIGRQMIFNNPIQNPDYFNPIKNQVQYDIRDSTTWLADINDSEGGAFVNFIHVDAQTNLKDITVEVNMSVVIDYLPNFFNSFDNKNGQVGIRVYYGESNESYVQETLWNSVEFVGTSDLQQVVNESFSISIPFVNNTNNIWVSFVSATRNGAGIRVTFNECTTKITATSISYNSIVRMARLIDVMKYNALSSANLPVSAPRWDFGGELYNLYITSQALMRGLTDKPFNISTKDIVDDYLPMVDGDYQIQPDGTVFYGVGTGKGTNSDFYRDYEILSLTQADATDEFGQPLGQIEGFNLEVNQDFRVNEFSFGFKNYASQKETEQGNTYDITHGKLETLLPNKRVENKKNVEVGFIFDPFMWEQARVKAFDLSDTTATQNDDKIYAMELTELQEADREYTETASLRHFATGEDIFLNLRNNQSFSWLLLGIEVGDEFYIVSGGNNTGGPYTVIEVSDIDLRLQSPGGTVTGVNNEVINTTFTYWVGDSVTLTNRTNEGFSEITGIADGENFSSLAHTAKRSVLNYYSSYLATCCMYKPGMNIKITDYKNNPDAYTRLDTETTGIREGDDFTPSNPILTPNLVTIKAVMSLQKVFDTQVKQKIHNGFVRSFDSTGLPFLGYIKNLSFIPKTRGGSDASDVIGECTLVLKEKYQEFYLEIWGEGDGMIRLSNGESASDFNFYIENKKLYIFDETGKQLFVPVPFNRVKVNNSTQAATPEQLEQRLNLLKP